MVISNTSTTAIPQPCSGILAKMGLCQHIGLIEAILAAERKTARRLLEQNFLTEVETLISFRNEVG